MGYTFNGVAFNVIHQAYYEKRNCLIVTVAFVGPEGLEPPAYGL